MLCQECKVRSATIHLCQIVGDRMTKRDLCEVCGKEFTDMASGGSYPPVESLGSGAMDITAMAIGASHSRYTAAAYLFVQAVFRKAQRDASKIPSAGVVHVSAADLLEALRKLAMESFGRQAKTRLNSWGIFKCEDFGQIVFQLVRAGLLTKQETDAKEDFEGGYDFDTAFPA
jgi:uncharacterized repeat protein (TIGR04138 family)